ncbi:hypothetical protein Sjap_009956 [Stephania japonica]|uniref:RING-type E3 ubiquitin transferase n=1 Tax=Stephania japonica TaxID=461633 RepID=A0AAP0J8P9_9MAGN
MTSVAPEPTDPPQYWCYQCDKRVSIEPQTNDTDIICYECKNGFVESMPFAAAPAPPPPSDYHLPSAENGSRARSFSHQFLQVLRLLSQAARDEDAPPPPPPNGSESEDFLRIELDGWHNDVDDDEDDEDGDEDDGSDGDEIEFGTVEADQGGIGIGIGIGEEEDDQEVRVRRNFIRLRSLRRRNQILNWPEILELHVGNSEDYVDAAGYEAVLQNLAESEGGGRRGAPPAAKSAVAGLKKVVVLEGEEEVVMCAICKEGLGVGCVVKEMPCGHGYHEECIEQWLGSRNSCPVCRFELPTDDPDYEEQRKKKRSSASSSGDGSSTSNNNNNNSFSNFSG